eukprot:TRINITY_DN1888_c0_g1_i10.p1 TRINITY_DN1888_c0_g1~~TRINITY_DN1888_c0_g1_i10.p1  ORF type:complete len:177 (-),score=16.05 TRINITY_DN1888_c0_g1_i10:90-620(-)
MIIHENLLYSTDYGSGKVKIYNLHDFELINSFPVLGPCFDMVISYPFIFSACWNKIIEVVDLRTYEKVQVLRGHQSIVNKLLIRNDILYSCSADKTIRKWDISEESIHGDMSIKAMFIYKGHSSKVTDVVMINGKLWSGDENGDILVIYSIMIGLTIDMGGIYRGDIGVFQIRISD